MWNLPTRMNTLVQYKTGDGFEYHLPSMLSCNHLYIGYRNIINSEMKNTNARCVTVYGLKKVLEEETVIQSSIVLDIKIPRTNSQAFKALMNVCRGRSLVILHPPLLDVESTNTLMLLLSVTKNPQLHLKKWNLFARTSNILNRAHRKSGKLS